ncbi:monocarboxylate transporter 14-like [Acanthaster planci]|uniref:Monocarboxylate transporter 14-like n=1 Tax=Acanthaster planci TaxID=133434 RepID=A0A8B7ZPJ2_ACAPL|nr:monocarboxylate transporter 14-like [Acanthaster planci]
MTDGTVSTEATSKHELPSSRARSVSEPKSEQPPGPEPPDSGWAWMVLLGTFFVTFSSIGYIVAMSVFFLSWKNEFESTSAETSIVISIGSLTRGIASPFVGALFTKFSARTIVMVGSLISATGILLTSFGTSIPFLIGTTGVLAAIGFSFQLNANFVILRQYFKKRFALVVGLTQSGVSASQVALPPLFNWLINEYGWRGALLIITGISLNTLAAGALMRPVRPKITKKKKKQPQLSSVSNVHGSQLSTDNGDRPGTDCGGETDDVKDGGQTLMAVDEELHTLSMTPTHDTATLVKEDADGTSLQPDENEREDDEWSDFEEEFPAMINSLADPFTITIADDHVSRVTVTITHAKPDSPWGYFKMYLKRTRTFLLDTYGLRRLAHNLCYILLCGATFSMAYAWTAMNVHFVPRAERVGIESEASSLFLSIIGGSGFLCRPLIGVLVDKRYISAPLAYAGGMLVMTLAISLIPLFTTFGPLAAVSVMLGLGSGVSGSLVLMTLQKLIRPAEAAAATGILLFGWGIGELAGAFFSGLLFDVTEIYDYSFYCSGAASFIASIFCVAIYFRLRARRRRHRAKQSPAVALENPGLVVNTEQSIPNVELAQERAYVPAVRDHEAVNPLYSVEQDDINDQTTAVSTEEEPSSGPRKSDLPMKKRWLSRLDHKQDHRVEMSHISKSDSGAEVHDGTRGAEKATTGLELEINDDEPAFGRLEHMNFENPAFEDEEELPKDMAESKEVAFENPIFREDNQSSSGKERATKIDDGRHFKRSEDFGNEEVVDELDCFDTERGNGSNSGVENPAFEDGEELPVDVVTKGVVSNSDMAESKEVSFENPIFTENSESSDGNESVAEIDDDPHFNMSDYHGNAEAINERGCFDNEHGNGSNSDVDSTGALSVSNENDVEFSESLVPSESSESLGENGDCQVYQV